MGKPTFFVLPDHQVFALRRGQLLVLFKCYRTRRAGPDALGTEQAFAHIQRQSVEIADRAGWAHLNTRMTPGRAQGLVEARIPPEQLRKYRRLSGVLCCEVLLPPALERCLEHLSSSLPVSWWEPVFCRFRGPSQQSPTGLATMSCGSRRGTQVRQAAGFRSPYYPARLQSCVQPDLWRLVP